MISISQRNKAIVREFELDAVQTLKFAYSSFIIFMASKSPFQTFWILLLLMQFLDRFVNRMITHRTYVYYDINDNLNMISI